MYPSSHMDVQRSITTLGYKWEWCEKTPQHSSNQFILNYWSGPYFSSFLSPQKGRSLKIASECQCLEVFPCSPSLAALVNSDEPPAALTARVSPSHAQPHWSTQPCTCTHSCTCTTHHTLRHTCYCTFTKKLFGISVLHQGVGNLS